MVLPANGWLKSTMVLPPETDFMVPMRLSRLICNPGAGWIFFCLKREVGTSLTIAASFLPKACSGGRVIV